MQGTQLDTRSSETIELVHKADAAVNARDIDGFLALMTDDIVWETTSPPDGDRCVGKAAVRAAGADDADCASGPAGTSPATKSVSASAAILCVIGCSAARNYIRSGWFTEARARRQDSGWGA